MVPVPKKRVHAEIGKPVIDPSVWTAQDLAKDKSWLITVSEGELEDLRYIASTIRPRIAEDPNQLLLLTRDDLPIGRFAKTLAKVRHGLRDGLGLAIVRGLPVEEWDRLDLMIAYWAIGRYLGRALSNNGEGDMIGHVLDAGRNYDNPNHRGYQTKVTMDFHIDQCDVVCLLCLQTARAGGLSKLVSSTAVYNETLNRRPDLIDVLSQPFYWSRHGEVSPGQKHWYTAPILNFLEGYLSTSCGPKHIEKGHLLSDTPDITSEQIEAIKLWEEICEDLHVEIAFEKGDIQFLNSAVTMHTRTAYEDWSEPERRRHLWRLWLSMCDFRPRAPYFENWKDGVNIAGITKRLRLDYVMDGD